MPRFRSNNENNPPNMLTARATSTSSKRPLGQISLNNEEQQVRGGPSPVKHARIDPPPPPTKQAAPTSVEDQRVVSMLLHRLDTTLNRLEPILLDQDTEQCEMRTCKMDMESMIKKLERIDQAAAEFKRKNARFTINKLPDELLVRIFNCLSYRDLAQVEQTSKKWNELAKIAWLAKRELCMDQLHVFGLPPVGNGSGDDLSLESAIFDRELTKPYSRGSFFNILCHLLANKVNVENIRSLNLQRMNMTPRSYYTRNSSSSSVSYPSQYLMPLIAAKCVNLVKLTLYSINSRSERETIIKFLETESVQRSLSKLKLSGSLVDDDLVEIVFKKCVNLRGLTINKTDSVTGKCLINTPSRMTKIRILWCSSLRNTHLVQMVKQCPNLVKLDLLLTETCLLTEFVSALVDSLRCVEALSISLVARNSTIVTKTERIAELGNKCAHSLKRLFLPATFLTNERCARLLNELTQLKSLTIQDRNKELTSAAFTSLPIRAPLETLHLDMYGVTGLLDDEMVRALKQCAQSMRILLVVNAARRQKLRWEVGSESVSELLDVCPRIEFLSLNETRVDNRLLEKAVSLDRHFFMDCRDTQVNVESFLADQTHHGDGAGHLEVKRIFAPVDSGSSGCDDGHNTKSLLQYEINKLTVRVKRTDKVRAEWMAPSDQIEDEMSGEEEEEESDDHDSDMSDDEEEDEMDHDEDDDEDNEGVNFLDGDGNLGRDDDEDDDDDDEDGDDDDDDEDDNIVVGARGNQFECRAM